MVYHKPYPEELKQKAIELRLQGVSYAKISEELVIGPETARFFCRGITLSTAQRSANAKKAHPIEIEEQVVKLRHEGKAKPEIAEILGVSLVYVKNMCRKHKITVPPEVRNRNAFEGMIAKRPNYVQEMRAAASKPEALEKRRTLKKEQRQEVIRLRQEGLSRREIAKRFGVKPSYIKLVCKEANVTIPMEVRQRNSYHANLAKDPDFMKELRAKGLTPEALAKRRISLKETYSDPELRKVKGKQSATWWASLSGEEKEKMVEERTQKARNSAGFRQYAYRFIGASVDLDFKTAFEAKMHEYAKSYGGKFHGEYLSSKVKTQFECEAGHQFEMIPNAILRGVWCARCSHVGPSKGQMQVYDYVVSLVPDLEVVLGDRKVLKRQELDIYVPAKNFAIEYNGLYYHSSAVPTYKRGRHRKKALSCHEAGVSLLAIFEDEWADPKKRELIKAMIRWRLGKSTAKTLDARKLEMCEVSYTPETVEFFDRNHLDGCSKFSYALGLRHEGRLVCCAAFRKNFAGEFELARLATDQGFSVRGGAGRLISKAPRPLVSYSNNRLSHGDVYKKLGFTFVYENPSPSYWYTDMKVRVWRWKCRKINDPEIVAQYPTEELQALNGVHSLKLFGDDRALYRIEDYGHKKWLLP